MAGEDGAVPGPGPRSGPSRAALLARLPLAVALMVAIFFLPAGRLDWYPAWALIAVYLAFLGVYGVWVLRRDPGQLAERRRPGANVKKWDRALMRAYTVLLVAMLVLAGLDAGRFGWTSTPAALRAAGWAVMAAAGAWILWVSRSNTFLSSYVRIQEDRGQQVVSRGPYRWVRHPMYAGIIALVVCIPVVLGSWWGLVPAGLIAALFVARTELEDRTLQAELPGYREYAARVRYRLVPGVY